MKPAAEPTIAGLGRYRTRLLAAMMLVVSALTLLGIYFVQRGAAADAEAAFQRDFQAELASLHQMQELRNSAVATRASRLAENPRIHAALEDNAIDLLYPSAKEELRDLTARPTGDLVPNDGLHAKFYRFLDSRGQVIAPTTPDAGELSPNEQTQLAETGLPTTMQRGYIVRASMRTGEVIDEIIAVPIRSTESQEVIAALVLGFKPVAVVAHKGDTGIKSGIFTRGKLHLPALAPALQARLGMEVKQALSRPHGEERSFTTTIGGLPHLLFFKELNSHSNFYPPAYEVCVYPLAQLLARQRQLRWEILGAGGLLLLGGYVASNVFSKRLSQPVEKLAVVSEENRAQRQRAEKKLQLTSEELERSARFSADASHQLKSPITVLRAGLDSLLTREGFPAEVYEEISSLIHQTYRLTGVVEDLLLLSRMDAGNLRLNMHAVNLTQIVEEWLDDLRAMPEGDDLHIETEIPDGLQIAGEARFTALVVQNLLDNARKYNCAGGSIRIHAHETNEQVELRVANTGRGVPLEAQPFIFERFHRASAGHDVPGHGLGLNLARELMHLHGGELRLLRSDAEWTEFGAVFSAAAPTFAVTS